MNFSAEMDPQIENARKPARPHQRKTGETDAVQHEIDAFFQGRGRRPRILIGGLIGGDGKRRMNEAATRFSRHGFDVDISPAHAAPRQLARMAMENDVHLVGLLSDGDAALELADALGDLSRGDIGIVVCARRPSDAGGDDLKIPRIDPDDADDVLRLLKEVMTTCPKI